MLLSILDNFSSICSWWMLPLLIISWLLGSWFWNLSKGNQLRTNISDLEANVAGLKTKILDLKSDLNTKTHENKTLESDKAALRSRVATAETKFMAEREVKTALEEEVSALKKKYLE
jgi:regulator of replication initiation timing